MDWDSLDIGQSESSPTGSQSGDLPTKVVHHERDKHKREKHSGKELDLSIGLSIYTVFPDSKPDSQKCHLIILI